MGFFNFIETFFFISLGITFVLILLLVYHFKNRICTLEQKGNTMFEIVNGVVKELTNIKKMVIQQGIGASMLSTMGAANMFSKANPEQVLVNGELKPVSPYQIPNHVKSNQYNIVDEESDSDSDSDSDSSYTDEDGEDYEDTEAMELESNNTDTIVNEPSDEFDQSETVVINDEPNFSVAEETSIKIINYENESLENIEDVSEQSLEEMTEIDLVHEEDETEIENLDEEEDPLEEVNDEHMVIKLDEPSESTTQNESVSEPPVHSLKEKEDSYKRLTLNQLKATVIAKGITTDTSKLKKNELIKLLANFEEHATKE
jgi:hypothetical protein